MKINNIRNFSIIAHIDHGKSTLSDRIISICGGLSKREMKAQVLDSMDLERERGITIKAQSVTLEYSTNDQVLYKLNFIDTPGHVDFSYEVSRSLAACEGALLIVDAVQGIKAQTLSHFYAAIDANLKIIPVINKIDLQYSDPNRVAQEIKDIIGVNICEMIYCSAKTGFGIKEVIERLITNIPPPAGKLENPLQALIIDSWFDNYYGIVLLVRIKNGVIYKRSKIVSMNSNKVCVVDRLGIFTPKKNEKEYLYCGEVGWLICGIKNIHNFPVGDTLTTFNKPANQPLFGFKKMQPKVYSGLFPLNPDSYEVFRSSLEKLSLNDSSLFYEPEISEVLGFGFRCGFLGFLHMDVIKERLEREYNLDLISTAPTVIYEIKLINNKIIYIDRPSKFSRLNNVCEFREPIAKCYILTPREYLGNVISLCAEKRGIKIDMVFYSNKVSLIYEIPMSEIILDFFDLLKSISKGYASLDYNFSHFQLADLVCIDILINKKKIDALSLIVHRKNSLRMSKVFVEKIKELIPRHQFDVIIQAVVGTRIIARSIVKQLRKNVIAKCYGGDITRKKKLLHKQKLGKKRMKQIGNVVLPKKAFLAILQVKKQGF